MSELETHPCFTAKCSDYARIHLPVAPKCNMQCNYCLRKYSCVNESRPGVVARVMVPEDAVEWYLLMKAKVPKLTVAGIAGPGDALANWPAVSRTLSMIREVDKDVFFCLSTNGLYLPKYAKEIAALGVDYVTVTVNAITSNTGAHIYSFINDDGKKYVGEEAAALLAQLAERLCCEQDFPHEIGVFLGYPLSDVVGFIENSGRNFTCCGCWKAYGDPQAAQRHFAQLRKCTAVYLRLFHSGTPILRLTVAA